MDLKSLTAIGLTPILAKAYALLIEHGELKPPQAAEALNLTRTNAYKVLDKLVEMELVLKVDEAGKITYKPASPMALTKLTATYRAEAVAREEAVSNILKDLLAKYHSYTDQPGVQTYTGQKEVAEAYRAQINLDEDIFFIRTRADIPKMTHERMHEIRVAPANKGRSRKAIMQTPETNVNWNTHDRSNLEITWANPSIYNAPVEWSVTKSSLLIVLYASEPHAILITDTVVAGAFMQIFKALDSFLITQPDHIMHKKPDRL